MNLLLRYGLISGAICGEAMVLLVLVNTILLQQFAAGGMSQTGSYVWGITYPLLVILIFEAGGIFSSWLCRGEKQTPAESLIPGFVTGVMVSIILETMWISNLISLASHALKNGSDYVMGYGDSFVTIAILLVLILMGGILSAFGSYIFTMRNSFDQ
ncbi:hypothetical protein [Methanoregula sp.]|jgi:hypothetical protein|uniref:hypothetical protein n=1 Tax=Methanoregula sp. TaxID=2052170 RepID=UPI003C177E76